MTNSPEPAPAAAEGRLVRRAVAFSLAAGLIGLSLGPRFGLSVLGGAAVSLGNIVVLRRTVGGLTGSLSSRSAITLAALTGVRYLLLGAALFAIIFLGNADGIGVACGLGAPLLAVLLELGSAGRGAFRTAGTASSTGRPTGNAEGGEDPPPDSRGPDPSS